MKNIHAHFSRIAHKYRDLRKTDLEPVLFIVRELQQLPEIKAASIGCGSGRYVLEFFQALKDKLYLYCIDCNRDMLLQLQQYLIRHNIENVEIKVARASNLPLEDESLDCAFTFNAVHHFRVFPFLNEVSRILRDKGYLFIYTRTRTQNSRNIWGQFFPLFNEKETRLYEIEELESLVREIAGLKMQNVEIFKYQRISDLDWLIEQARNHHYSTFCLYADGEFNDCMDKFKKNIRRHFNDLKNITWCDENVLFMIRKQSGRN